jgi:hypothetical protein
MSDEGKILVGTDGNPLIGHDGKVVLADRLYPMTVKCTATLAGEWYRSYEDTSSPYTGDAVWSINWEEGGASPRARRVFLRTASAGHLQSIWKYTLAWQYTNYAALEIPWGRIASNFAISYAAEITKTDSGSGHINPDAISARCAYSLSTQDDPSGHEEIWDRDGWGALFSGTVAADKGGSVNLPPTPPSQLWFAAYFDPWTPDPADFDNAPSASYVFRMAVTDVTPTSPQNRTIVYNLAT